MSDQFAVLLQRLEAVTTKLESMDVGPAAATGAATGGAAVEDERPSPMVMAFDDFIAGPVAAYVAAAAELQLAETAKQASAVKSAFDAQRAMLALAGKCKKPSASEIPDIIKATSEGIAAVQSAATTDRRAEDYNHRQAMSEAIPALGWVMVEKTPVPLINDMWEWAPSTSRRSSSPTRARTRSTSRLPRR